MNITKQYLLDLVSDIQSNTLRTWFQNHVIQPKPIPLCDFDIKPIDTDIFFLITDHINETDSGYRIIYSINQKMYGLEMTTDQNDNMFLGLYGNLIETLHNI